MVKTVSPAFLKPGPHLVLHDFLGAQQNAELLDFALSMEDQFEDSKVVMSTGSVEVDKSRRVSRAFTPPKAIRSMFRENVRRWLDRMFDEFRMAPFDPSWIQINMAAHGDGAFFSKHLDTLIDREAGNARALSLVYYFCRTPAQFSGGELRLHALTGGACSDVAPENDMAAVFPSWIPHEVLPVKLADNRFGNFRFSVNCWINKKVE